MSKPYEKDKVILDKFQNLKSEFEQLIDICDKGERQGTLIWFYRNEFLKLWLLFLEPVVSESPPFEGNLTPILKNKIEEESKTKIKDTKKKTVCKIKNPLFMHHNTVKTAEVELKDECKPAVPQSQKNIKTCIEKSVEKIRSTLIFEFWHKICFLDKSRHFRLPSSSPRYRI